MKHMKTVDILKKYRESQFEAAWLEELMLSHHDSEIQEYLSLEVIMNDHMDVCVRIKATEKYLRENQDWPENVGDNQSSVYLFMTWDDDFEPNFDHDASLTD